MSSSAVLLANNAHYVATRPASHNIVPQTIPGECLIIACMDSRVNVEQMFGLEIGPGGAQAGVIRCAGGNPQAVMRSVMFAQLLASIKEIMVLHHTRVFLLFFFLLFFPVLVVPSEFPG